MSFPFPSYAVLILPVPLDRMFTYFIPKEMRGKVEPGQRVIVQFGARKFYTAIVYELVETVPEGITPKSIDMILDDSPVISSVHLKFWQWLSDYYLCGLGDVMKTALPTGLRIESETKIELNPDFTDEMFSLLQQHEQMIVMAMREKDNLSITEIQKILGIKNVQYLVKNLLSKGAALSYEEYAERYIPKKEVWISLSHEFADQEEKLMELSNKLSVKAPKQSDALIFFIHETNIRRNVHEIQKKNLASRCSYQAIQSLIRKGIFMEYEKVVSRFDEEDSEFLTSDFVLTEEQQIALESIQESFNEQNVHLLHGVTSSGKTEIYIRLMQQVIQSGKQVLYLLPEIALTNQIIRRLQLVFGNKAGVYHHKFNFNEKIELWNSVLSPDGADSKYQIILGTRSALFLPFTNLGLIIIDEEHDSSYKQTDMAPRYHARDSAIILANILNVKVLLGSATPSVETYFNVLQGRYGMTELFIRYNHIPKPDVKIIDMTQEGKGRQGAWFISTRLRNAIDVTLKNKRQVILFQNRRGFVPIVQCTQCGWIPECKHCDITLTYHKKINQLKCHLCGYSNLIPERCPVCGNTHIRFMGFGTEKVEEEVKALFPGVVVARMDADSTRGKYSHRNIIQSFENGETDILVGTQMVSKGLDFKRVSLVGILNADNLMHFPDFRSFERGFQLLTQIIGRAGRHEDNGAVILQTRKPDHPVILAAINGDFQTFFHEQIKERQLFRYPPFYRLIQLSVQHKNQQKVNSASADLKKLISGIEGLFILGPEEPVYGRVKQYYIRNILIKIPRDQKHFQNRLKIREIIEGFKAEKQQAGLRIIADADPV